MTALLRWLANDLGVPETYVRRALPLGLVAVLAMSGFAAGMLILGGGK